MILVHSVVSCAIPIGMGEIEDKSSIPLHLNISVTSNCTIVCALTGAIENAFLPLPVFSIFRPIYAKSLPDICDHPVTLLPAEYIRPFVGAVSDNRAD